MDSLHSFIPVPSRPIKIFIIFYFPILILLNHSILLAQVPTLGETQKMQGKEAKVSGVVMDESNGQPVPYASVAIYRARDSTLVTGVMSDFDGSFTIQELPYGKFYIVISFIGYKKHTVNNILLTSDKQITSLGTIKVTPTSTLLKEVVVSGSTPPMTYKIDKKVIDIAQNITASGGTLADALQNVPSVETDVQGNITVRGSSNYTVLMDGRPSPIAGSEALQQIPANLVQQVEIITNPSAKYDAEGTAGIINVVMKKQKIQGSSGMINITAGTGNKFNSNLTLDYKISKFSFTLGCNVNDMKSVIKNNMNNTDTLSPQLIKNHIINGNGNFRRKGTGLTLEIDYTINKKNSITLTGALGKRTFNRPVTSTYHDQYIRLFDAVTSDIYYLNSSSPETKRNYTTLNLDYQLNIDNKGQQLTASAYYTAGPNDNISNLQVDTTDMNWNSSGKVKLQQQTAQNSNETDFRNKVNYSLPLGKNEKLEAGYQGRYFNSNMDYTLTNNGINDAGQTDKLNFKDQTQAGYVTYSNSTAIFDYQAGLRAEYEDRILNQEIQNKIYKINRIDFFPTIHLTRQLPWNLQLQASYTRRINRPQASNINPFVVHVDPQTIRMGNAGLLPEFANSYELNLEKKLSDASFISMEGFLKQTSNLIQQINTFDQKTQITTNTYANIDHDRAIGVELMMYIKPIQWFNLNTSLNIFNYHIFGPAIPAVANNTNTWNIRINPTFHVSKLTSVQVNYTYNAPTIRAQGTRSGYYFSTLAIKESLFKQKGSLTLQVRDLIGHANVISTTKSAHQYTYSNFQRESGVFMLTFSYRINNYRVKQNKQNQDDANNEQDIEGQE